MLSIPNISKIIVFAEYHAILINIDNGFGIWEKWF